MWKNVETDFFGSQVMVVTPLIWARVSSAGNGLEWCTIVRRTFRFSICVVVTYYSGYVSFYVVVGTIFKFDYVVFEIKLQRIYQTKLGS